MKLSIVLGFLCLLAVFSNSYAQDDVTFCVKYANALGLTQEELIGAVVNGAVTGLVIADSPTVEYFNGTTPAGSTNFLANETALAQLGGDLIAFFGSVLGCNATDFPEYEGRDMATVHQDLGITRAANDYFNRVVVGVVQETQLGVPSSALPFIDANEDAAFLYDLLMSLATSICDSSVVCTGSPYLILLGATNSQGGGMNRFNPPILSGIEDGDEIEFYMVNPTHTVVESTAFGECTALDEDTTFDKITFPGAGTSVTLEIECPANLTVATDFEVPFYCDIGTHCSGSGMFGQFTISCEANATEDQTGGQEGGETNVDEEEEEQGEDQEEEQGEEGEEEEEEEEDEDEDEGTSSAATLQNFFSYLF